MTPVLVGDEQAAYAFHGSLASVTIPSRVGDEQDAYAFHGSLATAPIPLRF
ncbi:hypothetical protein ACSVDA_12815 [Cytobacillus sp. Hm23]